MNNNNLKVEQILEEAKDLSSYERYDLLESFEEKGYIILLCNSKLLEHFKDAGFKITKFNSLNYKVEV